MRRAAAAAERKAKRAAGPGVAASSGACQADEENAAAAGEAQGAGKGADGKSSKASRAKQGHTTTDTQAVKPTMEGANQSPQANEDELLTSLAQGTAMDAPTGVDAAAGLNGDGHSTAAMVAEPSAPLSAKRRGRPKRVPAAAAASAEGLAMGPAVEARPSKRSRK